MWVPCQGNRFFRKKDHKSIVFARVKQSELLVGKGGLAVVGKQNFW